MMKNNFSLSFLIFLVVISACTSAKDAGKGNSAVILKDIPDASAMLSLVKATDLPFHWFGGEGTGTIDWDGQRYTAKMEVRIEHGKVIWVQIQKLGFEIGRMLIRPDSAFFINRLERTYASYSTAQFLIKYNLPADFNMVSKVFTGGAYIPPMITTSVNESDGSLYLQSESGLSARHWLDISYLLYRSIITDPFKHEWSAGYGKYGSTNTGQLFPYSRTNSLVIDGKSNLFDLDYSSIVINVPQEIPFFIPSHYEKI